MREPNKFLHILSARLFSIQLGFVFNRCKVILMTFLCLCKFRIFPFNRVSWPLDTELSALSERIMHIEASQHEFSRRDTNFNW